MITQLKEGLFAGFIHAPIPRGRDPVPQICEPSYVRAHSMINDNQILHGDHTPYPGRNLWIYECCRAISLR